MVYSNEPKLGLNAGVCNASCAHALGSMFVCLFVLQAIEVIGCSEGEVHACCLKAMGFSISVMCGGIIFQMRIARG